MPAPMPAPRSRGRDAHIDGLKGLLILLVVAGHVFVERVDQNALKWVLYGFHMPVFLGLSGYLLNVEKLHRQTVRQVVAGYLRILVPWVLASLVYAVATHRIHGPLDVIGLIVAPYFHLWYVPAVLVMIGLVYVIRIPPSWWGALSMPMILVGGILAGVGHHQPLLELTPLHDLLRAALLQKLLSLGGFFFLGVGVRARRREASAWQGLAALALGAIGLCGWAIFYAVPNPAAEVILFAAFNAGLVIALPAARLASLLALPLLAIVGRYSLYFYLWHPLVIRAARDRLAGLLPEAAALLGAFLLTFVVLVPLLLLARKSRRASLLLGV